MAAVDARSRVSVLPTRLSMLGFLPSSSPSCTLAQLPLRPRDRDEDATELYPESRRRSCAEGRPSSTQLKPLSVGEGTAEEGGVLAREVSAEEDCEIW